MIIYLDMDGVLAEFEKSYFDVSKIEYTKKLSQKEFNSHWENFIKSNGFRDLEVHHTAKELLEYVKSLSNVTIEILGSLGGEKFKMEVSSQKRDWLQKNGIWYKPNFVIKRQDKKNFAKEWDVLIDDHPSNVEEFTKSGGLGILHKSAADTIEKLETHHRHWEIVMQGRNINIDISKVSSF